MKIFLSIFCLLLAPPAYSQIQDTSVFRFPVQMDEVTVKASQQGFDVNAFIRRIKNDTTFYKAFKSLRIVNHSLDNDIRIFDKKGQVVASLKSETHQIVSKGCRTMQVIREHITGDYYKRNGEPNYYTAELYAYLFFTKGTICNQTDVVGSGLSERDKGGLGKSKYQLKQLMFNPGSRIQGVPLMGDRASIFDADVAAHYDFKLLSTEIGGEDCWLFQAIPKKEFKGKVVYDELSTWFRKTDYAILARNYSLSFHTAVYDFDVRMKVRLRPVNGRLLPSRLEYTGNWHVITKGRERATFTTLFSY